MNASSQSANRRCRACGAVLDSRRAGEVCVGCALESALEPGAPSDTMPPAPNAEAQGPTPAPSSLPGRFGDYELLEEIARGGMGVVFKARQASLDRLVAVKMLLFGPLASAEAVQRFRTEAAAAASLQHPNIVAIHEVGFREGQHFIAMDYVAGRSLAEIVRDGPLPVRRAAGYVRTIAEAIQYAHQRGILHRDLKPSNVLIDADDQPKVTDFGLAKRLEKDSDLTLSGQVLGSPSYMAPEQAAAHRGLVGKRSDVYSLGAILYHLLTGRPPFVAPTVAETLQQVQNAEPISPTVLNPHLPRDLKTICLRCLEKEPARRYQTAQELADELGRFLNHEPILARPVSSTEKAWRWCRRKPVVASLSAAVVGVFLAGFVGVLWQWQQSEKHRALAKANLYAADMNLAQQAWEEGDWPRAQRLLIAHQPDPNEEDLRGFEWRYLRRLCQDESRLTLATFTNNASLKQTSEFQHGLAFSPDGKMLAMAAGKTVDVWDFAGRTQLASFAVPQDDVLALAFCPTQPNLLAGAAGGAIWLWDVSTRNTIATCQNEKGTIMDLAFSPDGTTLAAANWNHRIELWEVGTKRPAQSLSGHTGYALSVAFSPDGKLLASGGADAVRLWDPRTGEQIGPPLKGFSAWILGVEFSPDGRLLAIAGFGARIHLWDIAARRAGPPLLGHSGQVRCIAFSRDGSTLVSGGMDRTIRFWSVATWRPMHLLRGHRRQIHSLAFSPDGQSLVSTSDDNTAKIWDPVPRPQHEALTNDGGYVETAALSPDGQRIASADFGMSLKLWDVASRQIVTNFVTSCVLARLAVAPDGKVLASAGYDKAVRLWDLEALKPIATNQCEFYPLSVAFSSDRGILAAAGDGLKLWDVNSGREIALLKGDTRHIARVAFAASGGLLATSYHDGKVTVWKLTDGRERSSFRDGPPLAEYPSSETAQPLQSLAFSPDGRLLAVGKRDGTVIVAEVGPRTNLKRLEGHTDRVRSLAITPDSRTLASAAYDGTVKLWNLATGQPVLTIKQVGAITDIAFSADGALMATSGADGTVKLWPAAPVEALRR